MFSSIPNDSEVKVLGDETLRTIARELIVTILLTIPFERMSVHKCVCL